MKLNLTRDQITAGYELLGARGFVVLEDLITFFSSRYENDDVPTSLAEAIQRERDIGARIAIRALIPFITNELKTQEKRLRTENEH
jgi:hypothetical protein